MHVAPRGLENEHPGAMVVNFTVLTPPNRYPSAMSYSLATTARASAAQGRRCAPRAVVCRAEAKDVTGITFQPFEAVQSELSIVSSNSVADSFARLDFHPECEAAINEQINIEYNVSYVYHALYAYFDRDNVGLPGFAAFFKAASVEEREHAELLMEYQNKRGGKVKLQVRSPEWPHSWRVEHACAHDIVPKSPRILL